MPATPPFIPDPGFFDFGFCFEGGCPFVNVPSSGGGGHGGTEGNNEDDICIWKVSEGCKNAMCSNCCRYIGETWVEHCCKSLWICASGGEKKETTEKCKCECCDLEGRGNSPAPTFNSRGSGMAFQEMTAPLGPPNIGPWDNGGSPLELSIAPYKTSWSFQYSLLPVNSELLNGIVRSNIHGSISQQYIMIKKNYTPTILFGFRGLDGITEFFGNLSESNYWHKWCDGAVCGSDNPEMIRKWEACFAYSCCIRQQDDWTLAWQFVWGCFFGTLGILIGAFIPGIGIIWGFLIGAGTAASIIGLINALRRGRICNNIAQQVYDNWQP